MGLTVGNSTAMNISQMAASFFKKADVNNDGGIDKNELKTMMANAPNGAKATANVDTMFDKVDTDKNGTIDETENANQLQKIGQEMQSRIGRAKGSGGPPPGGAPPAGGGGGSAGATGSSSDNSKIYDPADTNKDGTVSAQEALVYSIQHPEKSEASSSVSANSEKKDEVKTAIDNLMNQLQNSSKYTQQGNLSYSSGGTSSLFSLTA